MAEELGWRAALSRGEIGLMAPGKITATGPNFITYNPTDDIINVWDAKYSSSGTFPSSLSASKLSSWSPWIKGAVANYSGKYSNEITNAYNNGQIQGLLFTYP